MELARRDERLWAAMIDRLCFIVLGVIPAILFPAVRGSSMAGPLLAADVLLILALVGAQIWLLTVKGQTIGKRFMGLSIVKVSDMTNGGFTTNVLLRSGVGWIITFIPVAGFLYGAADPLSIFREDRRCIHDHIAGTCVVKNAA